MKSFKLGLAAAALAGVAFKSAAEAKRNIVKAVEAVAKRLGNTKTVCRKSYIHPAVLDAYTEGLMLMRAAVRRARPARGSGSGHALTHEEAAVVGLLERRLLKTA